MSSFSGYWIVFLERVSSCLWFNIADIYPNYFSNYFITVAYDSTFWVNPKISSIISLRHVSWHSWPIISWENITSILYSVSQLLYRTYCLSSLCSIISSPVINILLSTISILITIIVVTLVSLPLGLKSRQFSIKILSLLFNV